MDSNQSVVLDLFQKFKDVCDELGLSWYMINGSALGAVKYGGFVPWDDDIDVGMPRKDYEIFLKKAQDMLPQDIFLQNYRTDKNFPHIYSKLRNSNTTFIESGVKHINMNHGIFIDIFSLDFFPEDGEIRKKLNRKKKLLSWKTVCALDDRSKLKIRVRNAVFRALGYHKRTSESFAKLEKLISGFGESSLICNHGDRMGAKQVMSKEIYGRSSKAVFEGIVVKVPEKIDEYLTYKYGDWRSDPPEEAQNSHHKTVICDPSKSYKEYVK